MVRSSSLSFLIGIKMKVKTLLCLVVAMWMAVPCVYASLQADELLKINGSSVTKSEFESYMKRQSGRSTDGSSVSVCFNRFLFDKLKLADARSQKWDTLPVFKQELKVMLGSRLMSLGTDRQKIDSIGRALSNNKKGRFLTSDRFRYDQIFIPLSQRDGKRQEQRAMLRLDSIYRALRQGADFQSYSPSAPVWASGVELLNEFSTRLQSLSVGQFSEPFSSPLGVHIVRLLQKETAEKADSVGKSCPVLSVRSDIASSLLNSKLYAGWAEGKSVAQLAEMLSMTSLADSLLVKYWDKKNPSSYPKEVSTLQLVDYFQAHKSDYAWSLPHFKGGVIYCQSKKDALKTKPKKRLLRKNPRRSLLKKKLKKLPLDEWQTVVVQWNKDNPKSQADVKTGLFRIGQDAEVDRLAFKCGNGGIRTAYPYAVSLGKFLKRGPESYSDVADKVKADYLFSLDEARVKEMSNRFKVEINQEVLNTLITSK